MSKWHYDEAGKFTPLTNAHLIPGSVAPLLRPVADAFIANAYRIHAFWRLKPDLVDHGCVTTSNIYETLHSITGHVDIVKAQQDDPDIMDKLSEKIRTIIEEKTKKLGITVEEAAGFNKKVAVARLEELLDNFPPAWEEGFRATLAAMLTGGWTAFEVLASDLWEAAVNAHPRILGDLEGEQNRIARAAGSTGREKQEANQGKAAGDTYDSDHILRVMKRVTRGSFNAGELMGTILKEKFPFHKLSGMRKAYSSAFSERCQRIDEILSDKSLDKLNLIRNLFLHDAGIVREKFLTGARKIPWSHSGQIKEPFPVDGELVRELLRPVFQRCIDLTIAVDEWIAHKPQEQESTNDAASDS